MYCLTNMCYVCLEEKGKSLVNITSSLSVNKDIMHIISDLPFNLGWMKTKRIILICQECCRRLRETYHLLAMCLKNSAVMQGYMDQLNTGSISTTDNEAELRVNLINKQGDIRRIKYEIKAKHEEIYTIQTGPIIEERQDVFVNVDDAFIKEEDTWKREEVGDEEEPSMENNSTENNDNDSDSEISVNSNTRNTDTDSASSESTSTQGHTTNTKELNTPAKTSHKCLICSKSFSSKFNLRTHTRLHTGEKPYKCTVCEKSFSKKSVLECHTRIHTGEKPYKCSRCKKRFIQRSILVCHMRTHTDEKPFKCSRCKKCFNDQSNLRRHRVIHTGEKPYECVTCKKSFNQKQNLVTHMRLHTGAKPSE